MTSPTPEKELSDLEITKLCAAAMDIELRQIGNDLWTAADECVLYDPLHYDEQAMALVKKFKLIIEWETTWWVTECESGVKDAVGAHNDNLNRAICECVAKYQRAK